MNQESFRSPFLNLALALLLGVSLVAVGACNKEAETPGEHLDAAIDDVKDAAEEAGDELEEAADDIGEKVGEVIDEAQDGIEEAGNEIQNAVDGADDTVDEAIDNNEVDPDDPTTLTPDPH